MEWKKGYASSTSVYGDAGGAPVSESDAAAPLSAAGQARLRAERAWKTLDGNARVDLFRLGGIYGARRSALHTVRRDGMLAIRRAQASGGSLTPRIHVDDAAAIVITAARDGPPCGSRVLNVVDDLAATRSDVFEFAQSVLEEHGFVIEDDRLLEDKVISDRERFRGSKRVTNQLIKEELGVALKFKTYKDGLTHIAASIL